MIEPNNLRIEGIKIRQGIQPLTQKNNAHQGAAHNERKRSS
ncbi:hypothetical protein VDG1235_2573 [Verrucomicrobiia bacterium DG1235]|nr:hypothetical protein VDG1235_2573 [Verrucomicrobiae bacterium DG1235]